MVMLQADQRGRIVVLGCPKLWTCGDDLAPRLSPSFSGLVALLSGPCAFAVWNGSLPPSSTTQNISRWRSLKSPLPKSRVNPCPSGSAGLGAALFALSVTTPLKTLPPIFTSKYIPQMPTPAPLELTDVQFHASLHTLPIDLSTGYNGVISFSERDMSGIAIVFPKMRDT